MKRRSAAAIALLTVAYAVLSNAWIAVREAPLLCLLLLPTALMINLLAGVPYGCIPGKRLCFEHHGVCCLLIFSFSTFLSACFHLWLAFYAFPSVPHLFWFSALWCFLFEAVLFWNGIICVYLTSVQLGIRIRVIGLICGMIPIAHLIALFRIIKVCRREVAFETEKYLQNEARSEKKICATHYPILLVHGVFFRDFKLLDYWGRIPGELKKNGAVIYYGEHQSAASVAVSAEELNRRIRTIVEATGCEKVNIIAHSKGGLDCRRAIAEGGAPYIASLTTINTPHRGCLFAEYLLEKAPEKLRAKVASAYNAAAEKLGDQTPDFLAAVQDLTAASCRTLNETYPAAPAGIFCQSFGSVLRGARGGRFPLNFTYHFVRHFDGENDGLVSTDSFAWGEKYTCVTSPRKRGISHGDMIDLNRENIPGFDVREFYVNIVSDLRERGL